MAAVSKGVSLSVETTTCPWKPSAMMMLVSFRGANDASRKVRASFHANPANIRSYRLLGFSSVNSLNPGPMPTLLPSGTVTSLAIEVEPATSASDLGAIEWSVDGAEAPALPLVSDPSTEPSEDARFAALICAYGEWLIDGEKGAIDKDMLSAMARESFSADLTPDRIDFLNLVEQSLKL